MGDFPLKELWTDREYASKKAELQERFVRWAGEN